MIFHQRTDHIGAIADVQLCCYAWMCLRKGGENGRCKIFGGADHGQTQVPGAADGIDPESPVTVMCGSVARATIAASVLRREGFAYVDVYIDSMTAWESAGKPITN